MQETQVQSLIGEDPTCLGATKLMHHNYQAWALEPVLHNKKLRQWEAQTPQLESSPCSAQLEKVHA